MDNRVLIDPDPDIRRKLFRGEHDPEAAEGFRQSARRYEAKAVELRRAGRQHDAEEADHVARELRGWADSLDPAHDADTR